MQDSVHLHSTDQQMVIPSSQTLHAHALVNYRNAHAEDTSRLVPRSIIGSARALKDSWIMGWPRSALSIRDNVPDPGDPSQETMANFTVQAVCQPADPVD